jgi:hypothetical protein
MEPAPIAKSASVIPGESDTMRVPAAGVRRSVLQAASAAGTSPRNARRRTS